MAISSGTQFGPYEIVSPIGAGGMGEVYRARDTRLGRDVAIKILPAEFSSSMERLDRFEREARSASALNHPNIITIYDVGTTDSTSYLCMELVDGKSLRDLLNEGPVPLRKLLAIASQLADGLAKAHDAGIVHRDLKPENVMISKDGFVKILDFGLAKLTLAAPEKASGLQTQTGAGMVVGTAGYMSPEQASGKPVDFHSDQFSFGTILYEMITGKPPFRRSTTAETMVAIIREEPDPISSEKQPVPAVLRWILDRCLAKDPEERYASTTDLARDLQAIRNNISDLTGSSTMVSAVPPPAKRLRLLAPVLILIAFLAGAVVPSLFRHPPILEPMKMTTLTYSGKDSSPAASPDHKLIAFTSLRDGKSRIWLKQLAGGNEVVLTSGSDSYPRFSADGSTIFYIRMEKGQTSLYRVPVVGGEERKILQDVHSFDCSPDGNRIAFIRHKGGDSYLFTAGSNASDIQEIAVIKNAQVQFPRWSPDGKRFVMNRAYNGNIANTESILTIDLTTMEQHWTRSTWPTSAAWISNNQFIYGVAQSAAVIGPSGVRPSGTIVLQNVNQEEIQPLIWFPSSGDILDVLDRKTILLHSASLRQNLRQIPLEDMVTTSRWFTKGHSIDRQPTYSPDGTRILFSSRGYGNLDLMEMTLETGALRRITEDAADDWDPFYSRNGEYILWSSNRTGHFEVWMANADGSEAHQVSNDGIDGENPTMTPDSQWVVYSSYNPQKAGIWKVRPDGSEPVQLISGTVQYPEISPDGKMVAYLWYEQSVLAPFTYLRVLNLDTGDRIPFEIKLRQVATVEGRSRWMPDGKSIAYVDSNERGSFGVFVQDFVPGKDTFSTRRQVAGFDADRMAESFGISPDGTSIMLAELEELSSLVLIENVPGLSEKN